MASVSFVDLFEQGQSKQEMIIGTDWTSIHLSISLNITFGFIARKEKEREEKKSKRGKGKRRKGNNGMLIKRLV